MTEIKRGPSLKVIFADLLIGAAARTLTGLAFPGHEVWEDWVPFEETPYQDWVESIPEALGTYNPRLATPWPKSLSRMTLADAVRPILGLQEVFRFRLSALARMVDVSESDLGEWLASRKFPAEADRVKLAMLVVFFVQLSKHFGDKSFREFIEWFATPIAGFGDRAPARALYEGHILEVANYLALWSLNSSNQNSDLQD